MWDFEQWGRKWIHFWEQLVDDAPSTCCSRFPPSVQRDGCACGNKQTYLLWSSLMSWHVGKIERALNMLEPPFCLIFVLHFAFLNSLEFLEVDKFIFIQSSFLGLAPSNAHQFWRLVLGFSELFIDRFFFWKGNKEFFFFWQGKPAAAALWLRKG